MSVLHVVEEGEHLSSIAVRFGFSSFRTIWDHPQNAELKKLRKNPNVLFAGDQLFIPDLETREEQGPTEKKHVFVAARTELKLRVKVLDGLDEPRSEPCTVTGSGFQNPMFDLGEGLLVGLIPATAKKAELFFPNTGKDESEVKVPIGIGLLDPITEVAGQRQRLNNLGYFAGFDARSTAQFKFAVEEFQCDHLAEIGKKEVDGICDARTQQVLQKVHGV
ncbi:MAG: LysM domain-containing protein [Acidobacteriota bacterium]